MSSQIFTKKLNSNQFDNVEGEWPQNEVEIVIASESSAVFLVDSAFRHHDWWDFVVAGKTFSKEKFEKEFGKIEAISVDEMKDVEAGTFVF